MAETVAGVALRVALAEAGAGVYTDPLREGVYARQQRHVENYFFGGI